jgi:thiol-disulfide isomerase/thioredoxin/DNA-binding beta-propeller fold protein YncE
MPKWTAGERELPRLIQLLAQAPNWLNLRARPSVRDLSGRIILIDFWTYCCINCMHVIQELPGLEREFNGTLTVIGVHSGKFENEKSTDAIRQAIARYGIRHPVINDADFRLWTSLGVRAWPTLVLIAPNGRISRVYSGEGHLAELRRDIERIKVEYAGRFRTEPLKPEEVRQSGGASRLSFPGKVISVSEENLLFVADSGNNRILGVDSSGKTRLRIGPRDGASGFVDGYFDECRFQSPQGMAYADGCLYVADTWNHAIRRVDLKAGQVSTVAGTGRMFSFMEQRARGPGNGARSVDLSSPWDICFFPNKRVLIIAMAGLHQLWSFDTVSERLEIVAGNGREAIDDGIYPFNSLSQPSGVSAWGDTLYFVDAETSSLRCLRGGSISTLVGSGLFDFGFADGKAEHALMQHPLGVCADADGVYIADSYNHAIRKYDPKTGILSTGCGGSGPGTADGECSKSRFSEPGGVAKTGSLLFVADTNNNRIRALDLKTNMVTTLPIAPLEDQPNGFLPLPNLRQSREALVRSGVPLRVELRPVGNTVLNRQAPNWLGVYAEDGEGLELVSKAEGADVEKGEVEFAPLSSGRRYRIRGSVYYCSAGENEACKVDSYDIQAVADGSRSANAVVIITFGP